MLPGAGGEVATNATAVGVWPARDAVVIAIVEDGAPPTLRLVRAGVTVLATGSHALPPACPRNDLPGIFASRGIARLLAEDGIVPGWRCVVAGTGEERSLVAEALALAGVKLAIAPDVVALEGEGRVRRVVVEGGERVTCDAVVWCGPRAATWDLARIAGVPLDPEPVTGGRLRASEDGTTSVQRILVAGEVVRPMTILEAIDAGHRAGEAALRHAH
jgi:pyruvate/2-oxoglutarate dehydrogenase complex dihydrolipoamide dehydrogenase (E3) component